METRERREDDDRINLPVVRYDSKVVSTNYGRGNISNSLTRCEREHREKIFLPTLLCISYIVGIRFDESTITRENKAPAKRTIGLR